jgi:glutamate synthase domain-containing protein 3
VADLYWNARGGSHTDGGAFVFTVSRNGAQSTVRCADKFGSPITSPPGQWAVDLRGGLKPPEEAAELAGQIEQAAAAAADGPEVFERLLKLIPSWGLDRLVWLVGEIARTAGGDRRAFDFSLELLAKLHDRRYDCGQMRPSAVVQIVRQAIDSVLDAVPPITQNGQAHARRIDYSTRAALRPSRDGETTLVIFAEGFAPEGDDCEGRLDTQAYQLGWRRLIVYGLKGQRFTGCGLGPDTDDVRIDVFGSSGDYLASGIDGLQIHVHGSGQDQLGQILKRGTLVVHGDVGQTFMYGAKGGEVYVLGNAAGRPLINAAGRPRVVINGTCLDYLAESFMAGDPHQGGGFVILNGVEFDPHGRVRELPSPYPGSNLFSLASGGAIFVRDPRHQLVLEQLNGGEFAEFTDEDWNLIEPYLQANQRHFGISVRRDLLSVDGHPRPPQQVYRKVHAVRLAVLAKELVPE